MYIKASYDEVKLISVLLKSPDETCDSPTELADFCMAITLLSSQLNNGCIVTNVIQFFDINFIDAVHKVMVQRAEYVSYLS